MSTDLISQLQQSSQLVTKGLNEDTLAVAGGAGSSSKRISIKGGVFRKYVNGKEMGAIDERFMDVIFVRMAHNPHRIFYASSYKEGEKVTPSCWSSDSRVPDKEVKEPQAPACNQCPHSIKGANPGCRLHWRTAVVLPNDPKEVMQLVIPGKSCWGSEEAGRRPFQPYVRYLASNGISNNVVVTRMQFDTAVPQSNHSQGRFSQKPPSSQHTKATPEGAKALVMRNSLPASSASVKSGVAESNGGSKRQIRTGGFQKLGQELTTTTK